MDEFGLENHEQEQAWMAALNLAHTCRYEEPHSRLVTRLALRLYDSLQSLHKLGETERFWLQCAGILHDIGWVEGWRSHHKYSLNIILNTPLLPFDQRERLLIGSIARYHRGALPDPAHDHMAALSPADRLVVLPLAGMLRLADGLDSPHQQQVRDVMCKAGKRTLKVWYAAPSRLKPVELAAQEKSDLLASVFERKVEIRWETL
ncbi:MAG TPA: HD domain-containing protein [Anaerolineaceae bacterium]